MKHVNNVVYLTWINDVAKEHWNQLASHAIRNKYYWIVLKHEINYLGSSIINDELQVKTWVGESIGVKSIRYTKIYKGDSIITSAKSTWCLINAKSLKPQRIPNTILNLFD